MSILTPHNPFERISTCEKGGEVSESDDILAGAKIGSSKQHKKYLKNLWKEIAPEEDFDEVGYHGAGSRYFDNTHLAEKCLKFLPNKVVFLINLIL